MPQAKTQAHFVLLFVITGHGVLSGKAVYCVYLHQSKTYCSGRNGGKPWSSPGLLENGTVWTAFSSSSVSQPPCAGCVCKAPLTARVLDDRRSRVPLVLALLTTAAGGSCQQPSAAAEEAAHQVLEQVTGEEHVDPGVAAAVETCQQHGDDEGHVYRNGR